MEIFIELNKVRKNEETRRRGTVGSGDQENYL